MKLETYISEVLSELQALRKHEHKFPDHVALAEIQHRIMEDVKTTLNAMVKDGKVVWYSNVNGMLMFKMKGE